MMKKVIRYNVGHRLSLLKYHQNVLELTGDTQGRLISPKEYNKSLATL